MSDDRFTYIHLRSEVSLWSYVDDQMDWSVESLEDRFDQSIWDMIPPYQNEDDEGLLPSHAHPSYPFGNPYDPNRALLHGPQLVRPSNQPLMAGSSLLISGSNLDSIQPYWSELATNRLLWRPNSHLSSVAEDALLDDLGLEQAEHQQQTADHARQPNTREQNAGLHAQMRTPVTDEDRLPAARRSGDEETEESDWDEEEPSADSGAIDQSLRSQ